MKATIASVWKDGESKVRIAITVPVTFVQWLDHIVRKLRSVETNPKLVASARMSATTIIRGFNAGKSSTGDNSKDEKKE